jgi:NADH dehydrogenase FAD-containing subunit
MVFSTLPLLRNPKSASRLIFGVTTRPSPPRLQQSFATRAATTAAASAVDKKQPPLPRVVVLGSGWAGFNLALNMSHNVPFTCVSPRNHFIFTPLLPSAAVGTLECRCIQEPIRTVLDPQNGHYLQAKARSVDPVNKVVQCESVDNLMFNLEYDKLVIAVGVKTNTFGIESIAKGKEEGNSIFFLKQLEHARAIRSNIIACFEKASIPTVTDEERRRLLSFLVVGGGPTSCEFTAEVHGAFVSFLCVFYKLLL